MVQPATQAVPNQRLTGSQTIPLNPSADLFTVADIVIDRTVNGGLNSLTTADSLTLSFDYSTDGGANWLNIAGVTLPGGVLNGTHNGVPFTQTADEFAIGAPNDQPFPVGTNFRVRSVASTPVRITGTVTYS